MRGNEVGQSLGLDPVDPGHPGVPGGGAAGCVGILAVPEHRHDDLVVGCQSRDRLTDERRALQRSEAPEEDDAKDGVGRAPWRPEPGLGRTDGDHRRPAATLGGQERKVLGRVDHDHVCGAKGRPVQPRERGQDEPGARAAVDGRVLRRDEVVEHDRRVGEQPPGQVDVKVAHVADDDDVDRRQAACPAPEPRPRDEQPRREDREQPGLAEQSHAHRRRDPERRIALEHLVAERGETVDQHAHRLVVARVVGAEEEHASPPRGRDER